jgi:hypothetical protein
MIFIGLTPNPEEAFSSNRAGGQGYDDIYKFLKLKNFFANKIWKVTDLVTSEILPGAKNQSV